MTKQQAGHSQSSPALTEVARKFRVDDLPAAFIPGSRIANILNQVESGTPLSNYALEYLRKNGFVALFRYANNEFSLTDFLKAAEPEQLKRRASSEAKALQDEKERQLKREAFLVNVKLEQERAAARKRAYDNDPRNIARAKLKELRDRYGLSNYIEKEHFPRLMDILRRADGGIRLTQEDLVWLTEKHDDYDYYTEELRERFHENEAVFYACEFEKSKDPWTAVNASSHYRKCGQARTADSMLKTIIISRLKNIKLKSAVFTTHGAVKRDMRQYDEALTLGDKAHLLTPKDFRPCTLLGAVNMEIGNHNLGESWYKKAVELGANEKSVDDDLRSIFMRAESSKREELRAYLLKKDPFRYSWAKK
ncbi:MAG: hypothetical protein BM485_11665 [Desulfobulbaceae bacterium DB1]|nr:MAG: hypothetical protein BM485_11665 [Desulfobulbaceae bacterium DB1]